MNIEYIPISKITPYPGNAKKHNHIFPFPSCIVYIILLVSPDVVRLRDFDKKMWTQDLLRLTGEQRCLDTVYLLVCGITEEIATWSASDKYKWVKSRLEEMGWG
ncbi:MAG: hypothetical protein GY757_18950 [bacterium]|nr:hypothetical protein [bacterium]